MSYAPSVQSNGPQSRQHRLDSDVLPHVHSSFCVSKTDQCLGHKIKTQPPQNKLKKIMKYFSNSWFPIKFVFSWCKESPHLDWTNIALNFVNLKIFKINLNRFFINTSMNVFHSFRSCCFHHKILIGRLKNTKHHGKLKLQSGDVVVLWAELKQKPSKNFFLLF